MVGSPAASWSPSSWRLPRSGDRAGDVSIEAVTSIDGPDRFAIRRSGEVLAKNGDWEFEPAPSNRDAEFFARCRYATFDEAAETYARFADLK